MTAGQADELCMCGHSRQNHVRSAYCLRTVSRTERDSITVSYACPCEAYRSAQSAGEQAVEERAAELRAAGEL